MWNKYKNINTITVSSDADAFKDRCGGKVTKIKTAAVINLDYPCGIRRHCEQNWQDAKIVSSEYVGDIQDGIHTTPAERAQGIDVVAFLFVWSPDCPFKKVLTSDQIAE